MGMEQDEGLREGFREGSCEHGTERSDSLAGSFSVLLVKSDSMVGDDVWYSECQCASCRSRVTIESKDDAIRSGAESGSLSNRGINVFASGKRASYGRWALLMKGIMKDIY